jgi:hypothetical protein
MVVSGGAKGHEKVALKGGNAFRSTRLEGERAVERHECDDLPGLQDALLHVAERLARVKHRLDPEPADELNEGADRLDLRKTTADTGLSRNDSRTGQRRTGQPLAAQ